MHQAVDRASRAEAAATSLEAAYDVAMEEVVSGKKALAAATAAAREGKGELVARVEAAETAAAAGAARASRAEAAATSLEAAYDVANEAVADGKRRESALLARAEAAEAATMAGV